MKTTDEETILEQQNMANEETVNESENNESKDTTGKSRDRRAWVDAGIGAGTGMAAGVIGTLFTSGTIPHKENLPGNNGGGEHVVVDDGLTTPVVTDGHLPIAHNVNDSMSFGEAFRIAHDEVGPGGVFEWHGQLYGTYTAAEWRNLSSEEKLEYNNHLRVVGTPDYASNVSHHESHDQQGEIHTEDVAVDVTGTHDIGGVSPANDDEIAVLGNSVSTNNQTDDVEVEVLGVEYVQTEDGQEVAVGGLSVGGQEIYVLDADNDGIGDLAVTDLDDNGRIDENEVVDLSEHPVDMSMFESSDLSMSDGMLDGPDYLPTEGI